MICLYQRRDGLPGVSRKRVKGRGREQSIQALFFFSANVQSSQITLAHLCANKFIYGCTMYICFCRSSTRSTPLVAVTSLRYFFLMMMVLLWECYYYHYIMAVMMMIVFSFRLTCSQLVSERYYMSFSVSLWFFIFTRHSSSTYVKSLG